MIGYAALCTLVVPQQERFPIWARKAVCARFHWFSCFPVDHHIYIDDEAIAPKVVPTCVHTN